MRLTALRRTTAVLPGLALAAAGALVAAPAHAVSGPHTFSCALAWQPDMPRATGSLDAAGVPHDLVIGGGSATTARLVYYYTGALTRSTAKAPYRATPRVYDATMTMGSTTHPAPYTTPTTITAAFAMSDKAGGATPWKANIAVWPTSVPAAPNAICTTTG